MGRPRLWRLSCESIIQEQRTLLTFPRTTTTTPRLNVAHLSTRDPRRHMILSVSASLVNMAVSATTSRLNSKYLLILLYTHLVNLYFSLWNVKQAIDSIPETYEINKDLESYNYRSGVLFRDIREQTERFACSGAVYTQTSDVEGEVNGLITYDRRFIRPDVEKWQSEIASIYEAAASRGGREWDGNGKRGSGSLLDLK